MSLKVQEDGIAAVVRIIADDDSHELSPDEAEEFGEELIRAARNVATEQSTLGQDSAEQQMDLQAAIENETEGFDHLLDEDQDEWEIGATEEPDSPLEW